MCTVTVIARRNGYVLGMNRDEKLTRVPALLPARHCLEGRVALFPSEPTGGTWIGVNDAGATLALINWYSVAERVQGQPVSRGQVAKLALSRGTSRSVDATLDKIALTQVNPFRLIGVFPSNQEITEWRWNLQRLERLQHRWQTNSWISSGFDESGAQDTRGKAFNKAIRQNSAGSVRWLRRLHRSHGSACGPYSHCMHRDGAATVSYTEVTTTRHEAVMRYIPGSPCCAAAMVMAHLPLVISTIARPVDEAATNTPRRIMPAGSARSVGR